MRLDLETKSNLNFGIRTDFLWAGHQVFWMRSKASVRWVKSRPFQETEKSQKQKSIWPRGSWGNRECVLISGAGACFTILAWARRRRRIPLTHTLYVPCAAKLLTLCVYKISAGRWVPLRGAPLATIDKSFANLAPRAAQQVTKLQIIQF